MKTMRGISHLTGAVVGLAILATAGTANATLIGAEITQTFRFPNLASPTAVIVDSYTVGAGPEISCPGAAIVCILFGDATATFDVTDSTITFQESGSRGFQPADFNGFVWSGLVWQDGPGKIVGFDLSTDLPGLDPARVFFTDDSIGINLQSITYFDGGTFTLTLVTDHGDIPEPSTLALFAIALGGLGFLTRRRVALAQPIRKSSSCTSLP